MNKINIIFILKIIKDIFIKACVYFTVMTLGLTATALFLNQVLNPAVYLMLALASLGAGIAAQIFRIKKLPAASRHIAFFILLYLDFLLIFIPLSAYTVNPNTTFYLSIGFVVIYLIVFGVVTGIKSIIRSVENTKSDYEKQFKDIK